MMTMHRVSRAVRVGAVVAILMLQGIVTAARGETDAETEMREHQQWLGEEVEAAQNERMYNPGPAADARLAAAELALENAIPDSEATTGARHETELGAPRPIPTNTAQALAEAKFAHAIRSAEAGCLESYGYVLAEDDAEVCVLERIQEPLSCDEIRADWSGPDRDSLTHIIRLVFPMPQGEPMIVDVPLWRAERIEGMTEFCDQEMGWINGVSPDDEDFHSGRDDCGP